MEVFIIYVMIVPIASQQQTVYCRHTHCIASHRIARLSLASFHRAMYVLRQGMDVLQYSTVLHYWLDNLWGHVLFARNRRVVRQ